MAPTSGSRVENRVRVCVLRERRIFQFSTATYGNPERLCHFFVVVDAGASFLRAPSCVRISWPALLFDVFRLHLGKIRRVLRAACCISLSLAQDYIHGYVYIWYVGWIEMSAEAN
jgi:hypothetical protein